jgi:hypothetical protein
MTGLDKETKRSASGSSNPTNQMSTEEREECSPATPSQRDIELAEAKAMSERGTLTPEAGKQGVTSHLPEDETEFMYRTEDHQP